MNVTEDMLNENGEEPFAVCDLCGDFIYESNDYVTGTSGGKVAYVHSVCLEREAREQAEYDSRQAEEYASRMR